MPGMENPNWLAYNLGSAEYSRIWQNAVMPCLAQELRLGTSGRFRANP